MKAQKRIDKLLDCGAHPSSWNSQDVGDWLVVVDMPQYRRQFVSHGVDGDILLNITPDACKNLGVRNLAHQRWLLSKATELKKLPHATRESIQEVLKKTTVPELLRRQKDLTHRKTILKNMQEVFDDVTQIAVFKRLLDCVKMLGWEDGEDLVTQARDIFRQLKAKIPIFEESASKMQESVHAHAVQLAHDLDCSCADLLMSDDISSPKKRVPDEVLGCNISNPSRRPLYAKDGADNLRKMALKKQAEEERACKQDCEVWRWTQPKKKDLKLSLADRQSLVDDFCERMSSDLQKRVERIAEDEAREPGSSPLSRSEERARRLMSR